MPCENKSKTVFFAFSIVKNIAVFPALSKFAVKLFIELLLDQNQVLVVYLNL